MSLKQRHQWRPNKQFYDAFTHLCRRWPRQSSPGLSWLLGCHETPGLCWSRDKKDTWLPREGKGPEGEAAPLHGASCKATWIPQAVRERARGWGAGVTLQGALDLLHLAGPSSALTAVSPEGEARFCLDGTALPLGAGTTTATLAPRYRKFPHVQGGGGPISHRPPPTRHTGAAQQHTPPQTSIYLVDKSTSMLPAQNRSSSASAAGKSIILLGNRAGPRAGSSPHPGEVHEGGLTPSWCASALHSPSF